MTAALSCLLCGGAVALQFDTLAAAAEHMQVSIAQLQQQVEQYNSAASAGSDEFGKQYFPTTIDPAGRFWVGQITPVVHYCMGGLEINDQAQVCGMLLVMVMYSSSSSCGSAHRC